VRNPDLAVVTQKLKLTIEPELPDNQQFLRLQKLLQLLVGEHIFGEAGLVKGN
jgi:hypothetical protein